MGASASHTSFGTVFSDHSAGSDAGVVSAPTSSPQSPCSPLLGGSGVELLEYSRLTAVVQVKGDMPVFNNDSEQGQTRHKKILHVAHAPHHDCVAFDESLISREPPEVVDENARLLHPATQKRFR